jgi:hypothetical protein
LRREVDSPESGVIDEDVGEDAMLNAVYLREALEEERERQAASACQLGAQIAQLETSIAKLEKERDAASTREEEVQNATLVSKNEEVDAQKRLNKVLCDSDVSNIVFSSMRNKDIYFDKNNFFINLICDSDIT